MAVQDAVPVPPQMPIHATYDFRNAKTAPKGYKDTKKRKLDDYQEQVAFCIWFQNRQPATRLRLACNCTACQHPQATL